MKETELKDLGEDAAALVAACQKERVVITSGGQPIAIDYGIENKDAEDICYENSREFWQMIEARRRMPTIPWEEAKKKLFANDEG